MPIPPGTPVWPGTLPQFVQQSGYGEQQQAQVIESQMDSGPVKARRRFTTRTVRINITLWMTGAQVTIFEAFYDGTLGGGSRPFQWLHPRTRATALMACRLPPPQITAIAPDHFAVAFQIEILPT